MRFESDKDAWEFLAAAGYDEDSFVISLPANRGADERRSGSDPVSL